MYASGKPNDMILPVFFKCEDQDGAHSHSWKKERTRSRNLKTAFLLGLGGSGNPMEWRRKNAGVSLGNPVVGRPVPHPTLLSTERRGKLMKVQTLSPPLCTALGS